MSYYVVEIKKYVLGLCCAADYEQNWKILGQFNCMEHAEEFWLYCNSNGYAGKMRDNSDKHGVYISDEVRESFSCSI